ncbi:MAG TPA: FAD-binding oxidoreductase, partial [bacterium]|nr:FAD-binding oxidoreductase [bacterium]
QGAEPVRFKAGQYAQFRIPSYGASPEPVYRAYSISSAPTDDRALEFVIRRVPSGIATTYIFDHLKRGDVLSVNGPYGDFYLRDTDAEIVFIAGSTGIAPIKSILHTMTEQGINRKARFFFGAVQKRDLFYREEMAEFERNLPNFHYIPALSRKLPEDQWDGEEGLITEVLERHLTDGPNVEAYLCGSPGMIDACVKVLMTKGVTADRVFYDKFA